MPCPAPVMRTISPATDFFFLGIKSLMKDSKEKIISKGSSRRKSRRYLILLVACVLCLVPDALNWFWGLSGHARSKSQKEQPELLKQKETTETVPSAGRASPGFLQLARAAVLSNARWLGNLGGTKSRGKPRGGCRSPGDLGLEVSSACLNLINSGALK